MPDDVLIQLILLMMSTGLLETCREVNPWAQISPKLSSYVVPEV